MINFCRALINSGVSEFKIQNKQRIFLTCIGLLRKVHLSQDYLDENVLDNRIGISEIE